MSMLDSPADPVALKRARALLKAPIRRDNPLHAIAAAAFFAFSGLGLALVMITLPPVISETLNSRPSMPARGY